MNIFYWQYHTPHATNTNMSAASENEIIYYYCFDTDGHLCDYENPEVWTKDYPENKFIGTTHDKAKLKDLIVLLAGRYHELWYQIKRIVIDTSGTPTVLSSASGKLSCKSNSFDRLKASNYEDIIKEKPSNEVLGKNVLKNIGDVDCMHRNGHYTSIAINDHERLADFASWFLPNSNYNKRVEKVKKYNKKHKTRFFVRDCFDEANVEPEDILSYCEYK